MNAGDQPAMDQGPVGRWTTLRVVEPGPAKLAAGETVPLPGDGPRLPSEPPDPGLVWVAGTPDERASAELTMRELLSTWRSAERRLEGMPEGDDEWSRIREQIVALRAAYQRLFVQIHLRSPLR